MRRGILVGLVVLGVFWATSVYAQDVGDRLATAYSNQPGLLPRAVVFSENALVLPDGVREQRIAVRDSKLRVRYDGLVLLIYSNDRWFLLPEVRAPGGPDVIVLRDDGSVRVDLAARR